MPSDKSVGRPELNSNFRQLRDVPVAKDKPRINDQRKVRPHSVAEPPMGVRPKHPGSLKNEKPPAVNKERMQARDVPMKHIHEMLLMTDQELNEWQFPWNRRAQHHSGDAIAYQLMPDNAIRLFHVQNGQIMGPPVDQDSYETLTQKVKDSYQKFEELRKQRAALSMNPRKAARSMAQAYMRDNNLQGAQIGELGRDIAINDSGAGFGGNQQSMTNRINPAMRSNRPTPRPPMANDPFASNPTAGPAGAAGPSGGPPPASPSGPAAGPGPEAPPPGGPASGPEHTGPSPAGGPPSSSPSGPAANDGQADMTIGDSHKQMMYQKAPEYFPPGSLDKLPPYQLASQWNAWVSNKPTKGMMNSFYRYQAQQGGGAAPAMAAESVVRESHGMHVRRAIDSCKQMGMHCSHDRSTGEFRINHPHNREETAYYTDDPDDAIGTARHMKAQSMSEGYPDPTFDNHVAPAHPAKIGSNLMPHDEPRGPGKPELNQGFMRARELPIDEVTEGTVEMHDMLESIMLRSGVDPITLVPPVEYRTPSTGRIARNRQKFI